jgi:hypothetical protein
MKSVSERPFVTEVTHLIGGCPHGARLGPMPINSVTSVTGEHAESQKTFGTRLRERELTNRETHGRKVWRGIGLAASEATIQGLTINRANSHDQRLRIYGVITISYAIH